MDAWKLIFKILFIALFVSLFQLNAKVYNTYIWSPLS